MSGSRPGRDPLLGFGQLNQHCMNCGDERGGPVGHETQECLWRSGMALRELAATMPPSRRLRLLVEATGPQVQRHHDTAAALDRAHNHGERSR